MLDKTDPATIAELDAQAAAEAQEVEAPVGDEFDIPITKGGKTLRVSSKLDLQSNEVYRMALILGLKDLLNRGMSKISVTRDRKKLEGEELAKAQAAAMEVAEKNLASLRAGKLPRMAGVKSTSDKLSGVVKTEAMRLARNLIKDEIKAAGEKISHYEAKDITAAAKALLETEEGKKVLDQAKANVAAREQMVEAKTEGQDEAAKKEALAKLGLKVSAKKVQEAEKEKAERQAKGKALLSAAQAGKVQTRQRTGLQPQK